MSFTDVGYEDLDDYSPVVSDYEDNNDDAGEGSSSSNRTERSGNYNLIDLILGQNSNTKDDDDDGHTDDHMMELGETEDTNPDPIIGTTDRMLER